MEQFKTNKEAVKGYLGFDCPLMGEATGNWHKNGEDHPSYMVPAGCMATVYVDTPDRLEFKLWHKGKEYNAKWTKDGALEYRLTHGICRGLLNVPRCCAIHMMVQDLNKFGAVTETDDKAEPVERKWIPLDKMEDRCVYLVNARNFRLGVWMDGWMHGVREKWGNRFVDREAHWDHDGGTCKPWVKLTEPLIRLNGVSYKDFRGHIVMCDILESMEQLFQGMAKLNEPSDVLRETYP